MTFAGLHAEMVSFPAHGGAQGEGYHARPTGSGPFPAVIVIHHLPGFDEWTCEVARKLAHNGFAAFAPNLYFRLPGDPASEQLVAEVRAGGGMPDDQVVGDVTSAMNFLRGQPWSNGRVGVIGFCSGGRQAYLCACRIKDLDATVDCWGGNVIVDDPSKLPKTQPVQPIDLTADISCPLFGIFGNEDPNPSAAQVDKTEAALKQHGKSYEFHRYDGAGHAFFAWYRPNYRPEQAVDGWQKVLAFLGKALAA